MTTIFYNGTHLHVPVLITGQHVSFIFSLSHGARTVCYLLQGIEHGVCVIKIEDFNELPLPPLRKVTPGLLE